MARGARGRGEVECVLKVFKHRMVEQLDKKQRGLHHLLRSWLGRKKAVEKSTI